jgi:hypothetical protein
MWNCVDIVWTQRHIPEDGILHSHRCENLKSYISSFSPQNVVSLATYSHLLPFFLSLFKSRACINERAIINYSYDI